VKDMFQFFDTASVDGVQEVDMLAHDLGRVVINHTQPQRTNSGDVHRPDLLSFRVYGTIDMWWLLCWLNGIDDPINGIANGDVVEVPSMDDITRMQQSAMRR